MVIADEFHREVLAHFHNFTGTDRLKSGSAGDAGLFHFAAKQ